MVSAAVLASGRKPRRRLADLMIASIAIVNRIPLYTTNPDDFLGLDRLLTVLVVERPARAI
jgi:predicted nucleic acid-binding protein